ncbi:hypothetical protein [Mycolicibacterium fortuitum]|uniref:hypothetical protein n=1 Tax=Mycolicibacterium fortuitum TaxID=1766 RepID=UPI00261D01B1|nr:hypothetical protein [Mycolicibacterium fortuitum]
MTTWGQGGLVNSLSMIPDEALLEGDRELLADQLAPSSGADLGAQSDLSDAYAAAWLHEQSSRTYPPCRPPGRETPIRQGTPDNEGRTVRTYTSDEIATAQTLIVNADREFSDYSRTDLLLDNMPSLRGVAEARELLAVIGSEVRPS